MLENGTLTELLNREDVLNIYLGGSRLYGAHSEYSDYDFEVVLKEKIECDQILSGIYTFNLYSKDEWDEKAKNADIVFLESVFSPKNFKLKETYIPEYSLENLRNSLSKTASNSYVKCKKKLTIKKDYNPYIGKKSLWHSLRIIMFGIQIAKFGKITNYKEANYLYEKIVNSKNNDWEYFKENYRPVYNSLKSQFRELKNKGYQ